jgi:hypothetical protein
MSRLKELEGIFSDFFSERSDIIENEKKKIISDKQIFLSTYNYCNLNLKILNSFILSCIRSFDRSSLFKDINNNNFHKHLVKYEISHLISTWNHAKKKAQYIYRQIISESTCLYYSEKRDLLDSVSIDIFNPIEEKEFNVMTNGITNYFPIEDLSGNISNIIHLVDSSGNLIYIQDEFTKEIFTLSQDFHIKQQNFFQIGETRMYIPKKFIFLSGDKIYIKFRKSFFFKDVERTYIGSHIKTIETKLLTDWVEIFNNNPSKEIFVQAYDETNKLLNLTLAIVESHAT